MHKVLYRKVCVIEQTWAAKDAVTRSMAEAPANSVPVTGSSPVHLGVRVRMVETSNGATTAASTAGRFAGHSAAEAFIRAEVMKCKSFGSAGQHHWGRNHAEHQVRYWIETDQETASVRNHGQRLHG